MALVQDASLGHVIVDPTSTGAYQVLVRALHLLPVAQLLQAGAVPERSRKVLLLQQLASGAVLRLVPQPLALFGHVRGKVRVGPGLGRPDELRVRAMVVVQLLQAEVRVADLVRVGAALRREVREGIVDLQ
eukprot:scaffold642_cov232-Pinguiococcus_pyrenoidosus.AAC.15